MADERLRHYRRQERLRQILFHGVDSLSVVYPEGGPAGRISLKDIRQEWKFHGKTLLPEWIAEHPGRRPYAWWRFTALRPPKDGEGETACLREMGELTLAEINAYRDGKVCRCKKYHGRAVCPFLDEQGRVRRVVGGRVWPGA